MGTIEAENHSATSDAIKAKLEAALAPARLEIKDESYKHAGHAHLVTKAGTAGQTSGTHFRIKIVTDAFAGKSRLERHRVINDLLKAELAAGVHALAIDARAPGE